MSDNTLKINIRSPRNKKEFDEYYYLRWSILRKQFNPNIEDAMDEFEKKSFHLIAITRENKIVGVGRLHSVNKKYSQIRYMAVKPQYRKYGIGAKILKQLIKKKLQMSLIAAALMCFQIRKKKKVSKKI